MAISVGDHVVCNADKVMGNKPAKQRYSKLFRKELQGLVQGTEGSGRNKYVVCFDEVTTTKAFSARSLKLLVVENEAHQIRQLSYSMLLLMGNLMMMILSYYIRLIRRMRITTLQMLSPTTV